jgi:RNA polymerase sigma-70 factor (ECF subfamily)
MSQEVDPDADLLEFVRSGDTAAAATRAMQRYGRPVYRYCRAALHDAVQADDVHQQVFLEAFRDLPRFAARSTVRVWLFAIARHRVLDAAKRYRRTPELLDEAAAENLAAPGPLPDELIDDARLYAALLTSLAELEDAARTAVLLRYQQGFSFEEMAEICHEKAGTLAARVTRALRRLRVAIEARLQDGESGDSPTHDGSRDAA